MQVHQLSNKGEFFRTVIFPDKVLAVLYAIGAIAQFISLVIQSANRETLIQELI